MKKGKLWVSVTQPERFPFKLFLADEKGVRKRTGGGIGSLVRFDVKVL